MISEIIEKLGIKINKKELLKKLIMMIIGDLLIAIALVCILKPNQVLSGGINGLGIIFEHVMGIELGIIVFALNLPLLILGWFLLERQFIILTIISVFLISFFISGLDAIGLSKFILTDNILLACVYGGAMNGLGLGINFINGTSTGGLDIVGALFKKYYNLQMGRVFMLINIIIIGSSTFIFSVEKALFTLISLYINYSVMDEIQMGIGRQKQVFIMSSKHEEITKLIQENITRGVTYIHGEGAYRHKEIKIVYIVCSPRELVYVKNIVKSKDPSAFLSVSDTAEIMGKGFRRISF